MSNIKIAVKPLTASSFKLFGEVIEISSDHITREINYGNTIRHHNLAVIDANKHGGQAIISLFRTQSVTLPFRVTVMERHNYGSQTFIPMQGGEYLVIVAPPGNFDVNQLAAFRASPMQGVHYRSGVWHHYSVALKQEVHFAVIDRQSEEIDCDEYHLPSSQIVLIDETV